MGFKPHVFPSRMTSEIAEPEGCFFKNWLPVKFKLRTNRGQYITRVTAAGGHCSCINPDWELHQSGTITSTPNPTE